MQQQTVLQYDASKAEPVPRSKCFNFVKYSLIASLTILILMAIIILIVAETKFNNTKFLSLGIISLVGIIIFMIGLMAIIKEHIPSVMIFSVAIIFYLLLFMYSRVLTSPGLIILRTLVLLMLSVESLCFAVMVRDWRELQRSRTAKYLTAVANQQFYGNPYGQQIYRSTDQQIYGYQYYASVPLQTTEHI